MSGRILISAPYAMPVIEEYRNRLLHAGYEPVVAAVRERLSEEELLAVIGDIDGVICGDDQFTARVLAAAPRLKVISKWGTGIDSIDRAEAARRGVAVCNTPDAFSQPVADTVFGYILHFARQPLRMDADIRARRWEKPQLIGLNETTLGIIGVGNCGKAVARRAAAFGMRILGVDPMAPPDGFLQATEMQMVSLGELLRGSDFVTLHCDLNPTSHRLMHEDTLAQMKASAYLINAARGPMVEEAALVRSLDRGTIAGAALDVFEIEPLPQDSPLRQFRNCLLAPHNANSSPMAARRVHDNTLANLLLHLGRGGTAHS